jgi:hypothetical protein
MIGCYDCRQLTSGDCGKHGPRVIHVPAHTLIIKEARTKVPGFACECSVASLCEKFGGCLAECAPDDVVINRQSPPPVEGEQGRYKGPRDVFCPSCGAVAGERCFSDMHHMERLKLSDAMNAKVDESASPRAQDDTPFFCERCGREFAQKPEGDCPDPGCGGEVFKGTP